eukprot:5636316-Prymnesium_polylepis.1
MIEKGTSTDELRELCCVPNCEDAQHSICTHLAFKGSEWLFFFWAFSKMWDEWMQVLAAKHDALGSKHPFFTSFWKKLDNWMFCMTLVILSLRVMSTVTPLPQALAWLDLYWTGVSIYIIMLMLRTLNMLEMQRETGVLVITFRRMLDEIGYFMVLLFIVIAGFLLGFHSLSLVRAGPDGELQMAIRSLLWSDDWSHLN